MLKRIFNLSLNNKLNLINISTLTFESKSTNLNETNLTISNKRGDFKPKRKLKNDNIIKIANINNGAKVKSYKIPKNFQDDYEKNYIFKGKSKYMSNDIDNHDPESILKTDEDLDLYSINENLYHKKIIDEDIKKRKRIKLGIIKKKVEKLEGRQQTNFNLLTWDAKEQIKYLNLNEPEIWTVEKISECFPISPESCKKLLRSKWSPKTLDDLIRHDEKVIENWKLLSKSDPDSPPGGPALNIYEEYKKNNKLNLLKYATGIPGVNFERRSPIYSDSYAIHESLLSKPGSFSNIIKFKDDRVKKIFNRKDDDKLNEASEKTNRNNLFKDHLLMTKNQLSKSLAKMMSDEKK